MTPDFGKGGLRKTGSGSGVRLLIGKVRWRPWHPSKSLKRVSTNKMKQSWQLIRKSMDTRNYHAHMRIRICIENNQSGSGCVPVQQTTTRYHKIGLVDKRRLIMYISWNIANQSRMANKSTNRSIDQSIIKSCMWGPHQSPFYLAWINSDNSIV